MGLEAEVVNIFHFKEIKRFLLSFCNLHFDDAIFSPQGPFFNQ